MGIRFYCPNGHKLHVKAFQAGRRGICPHCGASVQIPPKSARRSSEEAAKAKLQPASGIAEQPAEKGGGSNQQKEPSPQGPAAAPSRPASPGGGTSEAGVSARQTSQGRKPEVVTTPATASGQPAVSHTAQESAGQTPAPAVEQPAGRRSSPPPLSQAASASSAAADPVAEAPDVVWYVRPAGGGQFGPATGDVMRTWIAEGRVGADSLVWREGWRDWRKAGTTFPELEAADQMRALAEAVAGQTSAGSRPRSGYRAGARRRKNTNSALLITILLLAVIVLLIVFIYVVLSKPTW